jgi:hypothetical protein
LKKKRSMMNKIVVGRVNVESLGDKVFPFKILGDKGGGSAKFGFIEYPPLLDAGGSDLLPSTTTTTTTTTTT